MAERVLDFIRGLTVTSSEERAEDTKPLALCRKEAFIRGNVAEDDNSVIIRDVFGKGEHRRSSSHRSHRHRPPPPTTTSSSHPMGKDSFADDGLYSSSEYPLTRNVVKPYPLERRITFYKSETESQVCGKILDIAIREVNVRGSDEDGKPCPEINCVAVLFKKKVVCRAHRPFNRKLHKLFIRKLSDSNNLSVRLEARNGLRSTLPLPLPGHCVKHKRLDIDFSMADKKRGAIYSGYVVCTVSLNITGSNPKAEGSRYLYSPLTDDPNDPRNSYSLVRPRADQRDKVVRYLLLRDPALCFPAPSLDDVNPKQRSSAKRTLPGRRVAGVVAERMFSLSDLSSLGGWCTQPASPRTTRPSMFASTQGAKHPAGRKQVLTVMVLRAVEVPVREESASVQPVIEVEWENAVQRTTASDGSAPVWQQTLRFEVPTTRPTSSGEHCVKLRLFDKHPVWGCQWLGEARIPIECHKNYQQLERWIELSTLYSPSLSFGYVQASPGHPYTRIYVLMKMEQMGTANVIDKHTVGPLSKAIQRCLAVPYKITGIQRPEDVAGLVMLLGPLPVHYGPLTPRQALNLNKVDHYGRSALLANLLQGLGLQSYVILGSSQTRKWASYALTVDENSKALAWDAESGDHYELSDNRCPLITVSRMINNQYVWDNTQKSIAPMNLKYDPRSTKDWQVLISNTATLTSRNVQNIDLDAVGREVDDDDDDDDEDDDDYNDNDDDEDDDTKKDVTHKINKRLRDDLAQWRTSLELPTIFNRHADSVLRGILSTETDVPMEIRLDKQQLKKLYRAYYTHGFIINVRYTDPKDLSGFLLSTKIHALTGPIEFALVCQVKKLVGKIRSVWLAVVILRNRA